MQRFLQAALIKWLNSDERKPLVLRGARQVGKTWLVRDLAKQSDKQLFELNFEKNISLGRHFNVNDPKQILLNLSEVFNQDIDPNKSILFLDEIQIVPELLAKLRWFAEDMPELPVITAGSLLEFALSKHNFSMPVGRIGYMYVEPLSFEEFLLASSKQFLFNYLKNYTFQTEISLEIHQQLDKLFREYLFIGGLPAAVFNWTKNRSLEKVNQVHNDLLTTYREDFNKYKGGISLERLDEVMGSVPKMLGNKFVYRNVNPDIDAKSIKLALNLLNKAKICHTVQGTLANGIPLEAEVQKRYFKEIFIDTGLCLAALDVGITQINNVKDINLINNGGIAEQVVGQLLRTIKPYYVEPKLFCWIRNEKNSNAEIDYIINYDNTVIPIEVKAGTTGSLKSLHLFMDLKNLPLAVRINSDLPSKTKVDVKNHMGEKVNYFLLSIPFYLIGQLNRLLAEAHVKPTPI